MANKKSVWKKKLKLSRRTAFGYIGSVFFGFIGGIIGYLVLRKKEPRSARNVLIAGVFISVVSLTLTTLIGGYRNYAIAIPLTIGLIFYLERSNLK